MSISLKLRLIVLAFASIVTLMFIATLYTTNRQKNDGLIINLAGRQRMLTQKMSKELYHFMHVSEKIGKLDELTAANVRSSMDVFDMTLKGLKESGRLPLTLNLKETQYRDCPAAKEPALSQLTTVQTIWDQLVPIVKNVLSGTATEEDLNVFIKQNVAILKEMDKAVGMMQKQAEGSITLLLILQISSVVLGVGCTVFAYFTIRSITIRLNKVDTFSEHFGQGNLTTVSGVAGHDELGQIGSSLDTMADKLRLMVGKISRNSKSLDENSEELLSISDTVSEGADSVSSRSQDVASAADQLSSNMSSVAAAVEETSTNVSIMSDSIQEMTQTISRITGDTENARSITESAVSQSENASKRVNELGGAAAEIGKVTEAITEISEQTNLLALNATIEAARAGEAGKGFAVVANEIKELAKQTAEATFDIRNNIESIQSSTTVTVTEITGISDIVTKVNNIVAGIATSLEEQAATLNEINENVSQASEGIQEVTVNVSHSSVVAGEVAKDISEVNEETDQMAASSTELANRSRELHNLSGNLSEMIDKFTV